MKSTINNCHCTSSLQWFVKYCQALGLGVVHQQHSIRLVPLPAQQYDTLSFGKVTSSLGMNSRTNRAEKDGLYCEIIFNSTLPYTCYCGKYREKKKLAGTRCDRCSVTLADADAYYKHQGHIHLAKGVLHPFLAAYIAPSMNISANKFRALLYDLLEQDPKKLFTMLDKYSDINDMILRKLLIPPAGFRPNHLQDIENINTLYSEIIKQNNRLRHFINKEAPESVIRIETATLQRKVDQLFINESLQKPFSGYGRKRYTYTSIYGYMCKYLQHFFGNTAGFSAKYTATYDANLPENHCGVPVQQLLILYKDFIRQYDQDGQSMKNVEKTLQYLDFFAPVVMNIINTASPDRDQIERDLRYHYTQNNSMKSPQQVVRDVTANFAHFATFTNTIKSLLEFTKKCPIIFSYDSIATALYPTPLIDRRAAIAFSERARRELHLKFSGEKVSLLIPSNEKMREEARTFVGKYLKKNFDSSLQNLANLTVREWSELAILREEIELQNIDNMFIVANQ